MTMPIQFDTLEYAKKLEQAGIPADQAEAQALALSDVLAKSIVVPGDLVLLKTDLVARMDVLKQAVDGSIRELRAEFMGAIRELRADFNALEQRVFARFEMLEFKLALLKSELGTVKWLVAGSLVLGLANLAILLVIVTKIFPH